MNKHSSALSALRFIVAALLILFIASPAARATTYVSLDGTWWAGLTNDEQVTAVETLISGYEAGYNNGFIRAAGKDTIHYHSTRTEAQLAGDVALNVTFSKVFGSYQQEITDFYSSHPSSMDVTVGNVMSCLSDMPEFTCDQVATWHY